MFLMLLIPMVVCLCVAAVQALRTNWKNMVIALLSGIIFLQFANYIFLSNENVHLLALNHYLSNKTSELEQKLNAIGSNQASEAAVPQGEVQPQR
jgi:hypothetical protein